MSAMIERVATALEDSFKQAIASGAGADFASTGVTLPNRRVFERYARAAIEAMVPFIEEIPLTSLVDTSDTDLARIWSFAADSQRGAIIGNIQAALKEEA